MSPTKPIYLPAWAPWLGLLFTLPIWLWLTHLTLFTEQGLALFGFSDWVIATLIMLMGTVVSFLMGYRKLTVHFLQDQP